MDECAEKEKPLTKNATTTTERQMQKLLLKIGLLSPVI
jgi:hypothetical protein